MAAFNPQEHADRADAILKARLTERTPAPTVVTESDARAQKVAHAERTASDNARVLGERKRHGG